ncbi:MAG TPA: hypothetical protein VKB78_12240, partial [Pirellulales bacterium]|nr:hypothetical protein [Pirellulales bacterium]
IARSGKPILLHPARTREMPDYPTEKVSKYEICSVLGWPYETAVTLARLVFSGIMDRFPDLNVIAHHLGGVIPYLEGRVAHSFDQLGVRTSDEDYGALLKSLKKRPYDYFKDFYGDTAVEGARGDRMRARFLRRRSRAVCVRLSVRQGKRAGLHPRHDQSARFAAAIGGRAREDLLAQCGQAVRIAGLIWRLFWLGNAGPTAAFSRLAVQCRSRVRVQVHPSALDVTARHVDLAAFPIAVAGTQLAASPCARPQSGIWSGYDCGGAAARRLESFTQKPPICTDVGY